jgi:hypothetical protein
MVCSCRRAVEGHHSRVHILDGTRERKQAGTPGRPPAREYRHKTLLQKQVALRCKNISRRTRSVAFVIPPKKKNTGKLLLVFHHTDTSLYFLSLALALSIHNKLNLFLFEMHWAAEVMQTYTCPRVFQWSSADSGSNTVTGRAPSGMTQGYIFEIHRTQTSISQMCH